MDFAGIGPESAIILAEMLISPESSVTALDISNNRIEIEGGLALEAAILSLSYLTVCENVELLI